MFAFNIFAITLGMCVALGPFSTEILYPGSDFGAALFFAVIAVVVNGIVYTMLAIAMPRSGGDYVYVSHTINPALGFMVGGGFVIGIFYWIALTSSWCGQSISYIPLTVGIATGNFDLVNLGGTLLAPIWVFTIGTIAVIVGTILIIMGTRFLRKVFLVMFAIGMAGSIALLLVVQLGSHSQFIQNFNMVMQPYTQVSDTYNAIIAAARDSGYAVTKPSLLMSFMALPFTEWLFLGFQYSVYMGGEVKTPSKSQPLAIFAGVAVDVIIIYGTAVGFVNVAGKEFIASMAYLGGTFQGLPIPNLINSYTPAMTNNLLVIELIGISLFAWSFMVMLTGFMTATRIIFGWAFNRVAPEFVAKVSDKFHSPWVATIFMGIGGCVFLGITAFTPFSSFILNYILIFVTVYFIGGFAAIALPYTKKDLFESSPKIVKLRIAGIPLIVVLGVINLLFFGFMLYSCVVSPSYYGLSGLVFVFDAICFIIPLIIYYIARAYRKRQGLNIDLLWKEIPPE